MMNEYIEKIYDLMSSPIVTPYNLLGNAKLENYDYVKYYKGDNGLIAEMKCLVDDIDTIFEYCFDEQNFLQQIFMKQVDSKKLVFDRNEQLLSTKKDFISTFNNFEQSIV